MVVAIDKIVMFPINILTIKNKGIVMGILVVMLLASGLFMFQNEALPFIYFQF